MKTFSEAQILERIESLKKQNEKNTAEMLGLQNFLKVATPATLLPATQVVISPAIKQVGDTARKRFMEWFVARFPCRKNQDQEEVAYFIFDNQYKGASWLASQFRKKKWVSKNTALNNITRIVESLEELKKDIYL